MHGAAKLGHIDAALLLLRAGADVNATDTNGSTPLSSLFFVVGSPQVKCEIAGALLSAGADPTPGHSDCGFLPLWRLPVETSGRLIWSCRRH